MAYFQLNSKGSKPKFESQLWLSFSIISSDILIYIISRERSPLLMWQQDNLSQDQNFWSFINEVLWTPLVLLEAVLSMCSLKKASWDPAFSWAPLSVAFMLCLQVLAAENCQLKGKLNLFHQILGFACIHLKLEMNFCL